MHDVTTGRHISSNVLNVWLAYGTTTSLRLYFCPPINVRQTDFDETVYKRHTTRNTSTSVLICYRRNSKGESGNIAASNRVFKYRRNMWLLARWVLVKRRSAESTGQNMLRAYTLRYSPEYLSFILLNYSVAIDIIYLRRIWRFHCGEF